MFSLLTLISHRGESTTPKATKIETVMRLPGVNCCDK